MEMAASRECGAEMDAVLKSGGSFPAQAGRLLQTDLREVESLFAALTVARVHCGSWMEAESLKRSHYRANPYLARE